MADYSGHRPNGHEGRGDPHLPNIERRLRQVLAETQDDFAYDTLRLPSEELNDLAGILVDFTEDLHAGNGLWAAYERYNTGILRGTAAVDIGGKYFRSEYRPLPPLPSGSCTR